MAQDLDPFKVSSPRIFLVRMLVFLILCSLLVVIIHQQMWTAFKANPPLNALIIGVLMIGSLLSFRQVIRLLPEVAWVNSFRLADPGIRVERPPVLRVDGHTDVRPIAPPRTNWDLSASRAIAVVQYLISKGIPPQRLVAAGFGEFQPIDPEQNEAAYSRNRRIELKLTER